MVKSILVSLAVLTLATSAALAATDGTKTTHHRHAAKPAAAAPVAAEPVAAAAAPAPAAPAGLWGFFVKDTDHKMYIKNRQDSGLEQ